jgi:acyl transferase domain-containing protein
VVEYALAQLWMSEGIQPAALIGHSIGELISLTIAESLSLEDALKIVVARAALMQSIPTGTGAMASCFCSEDEIRKFLENSNVDIAAINSPKNITISGKKEAVTAIVEKLKSEKIKAVPLQVSHAFHSVMMDPILEKFRLFLANIQFREPQIPVISNITGKELKAGELNADYLVDHIRSTVQFSKGIQALKNDLHIDIFLECGPAPVLVSLGKQTNTDARALWLHASKKDTPDTASFYHALQELYASGIKVDWTKAYAGKKINRVVLPTYAWQWKTYWYDPVRHTGGGTTGKKPEAQKIVSKTVQPELSVSRESLLAVMQIEAAKILDLEAGQKLDINKTYREQGFDSMMSAEFLSRMEKKLQTELKMAVLHEHPTPKDMHQYLIDTYFGGGAIDTNQAVTMADIMFSAEMESRLHQGDWHEIQPGDNALLRWFKKFDKKLPSVKS